MSKGQQATDSATDKVFCRPCQRSFVDANALRMHCRSSKTHQGNTKKQATPPQPPRESATATAPQSTPTISTQQATCSPCNRTFRNAAALRDHMRDSPKHRVVSPPPPASRPEKAPAPALNATVDVAVPHGQVFGPSTILIGSGFSYDWEQLQPRYPNALSQAPAAGFFDPTTQQVYVSLQHPHSLAEIFGTSDSVAYDPMGCVWVERLSDPDGPIMDGDAHAAPLELRAADMDDEGDLDDSGSESAKSLAEVEVLEPWSPILPRERGVLFHSLQQQCHSNECLSAEHYWTQPPSATEIDMTRKCNDCGVVKRKSTTDAAESVCRFHPAKKSFERGIIRGRGGGASNDARCANCPRVGNKGGCIVRRAHDFAAPDAKLREMQQTPTSTSRSSPDPSARKAVVIDCEMVGVLGANARETSEVVRLCAVDFLTGEVLIDTYVAPMGRIISWRTKFSGVTAALMREMTRRGRVVSGWRAARSLLWQFVDAHTVLIGHGLNNDLAVLRIVHTLVVDSAVITRLAVGEDCRRHWALKVLMQRFLGLGIQTGRNGHDCLEDTFAAREVVLRCLRNPALLEAWAAEERKIMEMKRKAEEQKDESD
ncbi:hypothetical protein BDW74DRAFT_162458 [Aspergillus multicolor]|uniref:uncharacterized protein n=1 Tax=Aspergillus multicolor TaxID=41759 RepID=UPI003CCDEAB1